jgi:hypothetical protein
MGNIKKLIADIVLPERQHYYGHLWVDICENLHIHLRNIRTEFSKLEWTEFVKFLQSAHNAVEDVKDYKENSGFQLMLKSPLSATYKDSTYYPNRFRVEDEHDGSVHIHYRDIRIHLTREEYNMMANAMQPIKD